MAVSLVLDLVFNVSSIVPSVFLEIGVSLGLFGMLTVAEPVLVRRVADRIFEIYGLQDESQKDVLDAALTRYRQFLERLGLHWAGALPQVHVSSATTGGIGWYEQHTNRIIIANFAAADPCVALREYSHRVLYAARGGLNHLRVNTTGDADLIEVESGLATYLPCSHLDRPQCGRGIGPGGGPLEDLMVEVRYDILEGTPSIGRRFEAGRAWATALWRVRDVVGQPGTDRAVVGAWTAVASTEDFGKLFAQQFARLTGREAEVLTILRKRGFAVD